MSEDTNSLNGVNFSMNTEAKDNEFSTPTSFVPDIAKTIGRGEDARNSFVYLTIRYVFVAAVIITGLCFINHWFFPKEGCCSSDTPSVIEDVQLVWDIAVPLITLALGYAFGRSKD